QDRPRRARLPDGGPCVRDAPVEPLPRLDPVLDLGEADLGKAGREPADEPLDRGAPGPFDLAALAAVDTDHRRALGGPGDAHLRAGREPHQWRAKSAAAPRAANAAAPRATSGSRRPTTSA